MYIIVVGAGKVGWNLARELLDKDHEVTLIESDRRPYLTGAVEPGPPAGVRQRAVPGRPPGGLHGAQSGAAALGSLRPAAERLLDGAVVGSLIADDSRRRIPAAPVYRDHPVRH